MATLRLEHPGGRPMRARARPSLVDGLAARAHPKATNTTTMHFMCRRHEPALRAPRALVPCVPFPSSAAALLGSRPYGRRERAVNHHHLMGRHPWAAPAFAVPLQAGLYAPCSCMVRCIKQYNRAPAACKHPASAAFQCCRVLSSRPVCSSKAKCQDVTRHAVHATPSSRP